MNSARHAGLFPGASRCWRRHARGPAPSTGAAAVRDRARAKSPDRRRPRRGGGAAARRGARSDAARWPIVSLDAGVGPALRPRWCPERRCSPSSTVRRASGLATCRPCSWANSRVIQPLYTFGKIATRQRGGRARAARARSADAHASAPTWRSRWRGFTRATSWRATSTASSTETIHWLESTLGVDAGPADPGRRRRHRTRRAAAAGGHGVGHDRAQSGAGERGAGARRGWPPTSGCPPGADRHRRRGAGARRPRPGTSLRWRRWRNRGGPSSWPSARARWRSVRWRAARRPVHSRRVRAGLRLRRVHAGARLDPDPLRDRSLESLRPGLVASACAGSFRATWRRRGRRNSSRGARCFDTWDEWADDWASRPRSAAPTRTSCGPPRTSNAETRRSARRSSGWCRRRPTTASASWTPRGLRRRRGLRDAADRPHEGALRPQRRDGGAVQGDRDARQRQQSLVPGPPGRSERSRRCKQ